MRSLRHLAGLTASATANASAGSGSSSGSGAGGSSNGGLGASGSVASSRWSVRDLGVSGFSSAASGSSAGVGSKERGDDWRDRAAANSSMAAGKRRWDASGERRLNGQRYTERDRDRGRDERYGSEAVPAWFTGDPSAIAESAHDGQWHTARDNNETDDAAFDSHQQPADEEATRFLFDKLGLAPLSDAEERSGIGSMADTRPAWAVQAERELAEHRKTWSSSQRQQRATSGYGEEDEQRRAAEEQQTDGSDSLDDSGLSDVSPEDAARAAALAAAMAGESEYDKLDAILAERAKQQTNQADTEAEGHSEEAKQRNETSDDDRPIAELTRRHDQRPAAGNVQEFIIPTQSARLQQPTQRAHRLLSFRCARSHQLTLR